MTFRHPLTDEEILQYNRFARCWGTGEIGWFSAKITSFSDELKNRLTELGRLNGLEVKFYSEDGQNYIHAVKK